MPTFTHGRNAKVYINGYDLTNTFTSAQTNASSDTAEVSAFSDTHKAYIPGLVDTTMQLDGNHDIATSGNDKILEAVLGLDSCVAAYLPAGDAIGATGYCIQADETAFQVSSPVNDKVGVSAQLQSQGVGDNAVSVANLASRTGTQVLTSVDLGAGSSGAYYTGWLLIADASGTVGGSAPRIQDSADNSTFADLLLFPGVASAAGTAIQFTGRRRTTAGTVRRYIRSSWTIGASGTASYWMGLCPAALDARADFISSQIP